MGRSNPESLFGALQPTPRRGSRAIRHNCYSSDVRETLLLSPITGCGARSGISGARSGEPGTVRQLGELVGLEFRELSRSLMAEPGDRPAIAEDVARAIVDALE